MEIEGKPVVEVTVEGDEFKVTWVMPSWQNWDKLQSSKELEAIGINAKEKLANSRAGSSKGAGKGAMQ